jgi:hypothetical protein
MTEPEPEGNGESKDLVRKAYCRNCGGPRNCDVRGSHTVGESDEGGWTELVWRILQCRGCDYEFVQTVETGSGHYFAVSTPDGGMEYEPGEVLEYWPAISARKPPDWFARGVIEGVDWFTGRHLNEALGEVYGALDNDLKVLAAIGVRTCFDVASETLGVDAGLSFKEKLDTLLSDGRILAADRDKLEVAVEAGHASAHRGWKPSREELATITTILEQFIFDTFVRPAREVKSKAEVDKVRDRVPPKQPRSARSKKGKRQSIRGSGGPDAPG